MEATHFLEDLAPPKVTLWEPLAGALALPAFLLTTWTPPFSPPVIPMAYNFPKNQWSIHCAFEIADLYLVVDETGILRSKLAS